MKNCTLNKTKINLFTVIAALMITIFVIPLMSGKVFAATDIGEGGSNYNTAPQLSLGREYTGTANNGYYKFTTTGDKNVTYQICGLNYADRRTINVYLYDSDGNKKSYKMWRPDGKPDTGMTLNNLNRNATYYLFFKPQNHYHEDGFPTYALKISKIVPSPARAAVRSVKAGKKKLTVKWYAVPYANKYIVKYRVKGSSRWKSRITTKTMITMSRLKKGKKYQVKVQAIRVVDGRNYSGQFSASVTKRVKK